MYDHSELFATVNAMLARPHLTKKALAEAIEDCHQGRIRYPIDNDNLHLFRRYRNTVTGNANQLIRDAQKS